MIRLCNGRWPYGPTVRLIWFNCTGKVFLSHINNSFCRGKFPKYIYIYIGTDFFARHHRWLAMADGWWLTIDGCNLYINTYHRYLAMADGWWVNCYCFEIQPRYMPYGALFRSICKCPISLLNDLWISHYVRTTNGCVLWEELYHMDAGAYLQSWA